MRGRRGIILIVCLWVSVLVTASVLALALMARSESAIARRDLDRMRARQAALSGIDAAIALLAVDERPGDSAEDEWWNADGWLKEMEVADGVFFSVVAPLDEEERTDAEPLRYGLVDESGKLDLNLQMIDARGETVFAFSLLPPFDQDPTIIDAYADWVDEDGDLSGVSGAEESHYAGLASGYHCKNAALESFDELLRIHGFDAHILYGEDWNANFVLETNESDGEDRLPLDDTDAELDFGLQTWCTIYNDEPNTTLAGEARLSLQSSQQEIQTRLAAKGLNAGLMAAALEHADRNANQPITELAQVDGMTSADLDILWNELTHVSDARLGARINLNTAPRAVLEAALGGILQPEELEALLARRFQGDLGAGPGWLLEVVDFSTGAPADETAAQNEEATQGPASPFNKLTRVMELCTVRSTVFGVDCVGSTASGVFVRLYAVLDRSYDPPKLRALYDWTHRGNPLPADDEEQAP